MGSEDNVSLYSPEGRIYQIEYAMKAMNHGVTTIAIKTKDQVIITSEKKILNKLQKKESSTKHHKIDDHIGMTFSGINADAQFIINKSREYMHSFLNLYNTKCNLKGLLKRLCEQSLAFSEKEHFNKIFSRPFGASIIIAGFEDDIPKLYLLDPSGSYNEFKYKSIGNASQVVEKEFLKSEYDFENNPIKESLKILKEIMKEKINKDNVEIMIVDKDGVNFMEESKIGEYIL